MSRLPDSAFSHRWSAPSRITATAVVVLVILALSYSVNAADRTLFPVLLKQIIGSYGFSLGVAGLLSTIFTLGVGLGGLPAGYLMNRMSRKRLMVIGIAVYSVFTILTPLALNGLDMGVYRTLSGAGEALQVATLYAAIGAYFYTHRSFAIGVLNVSYGFGSAIGPLVGVRLEALTGFWHVPFYVLGLAGFIFVAVILLFIHPKFTEAVDYERDALYGQTGAGGEVLPKSLFNKDSILLCVVSVAGGLSLYSYLGLYPTFLQEKLGLTLANAGFAASMFGIGSLVASIPAGWLGDRLGNRLMLQVAYVAAALCGFLMFFVVKTPGGQALLSFLEGGFASGFVFVNLTSALQRSVRAASVGLASGAFITFFYLPSSVAGYLFGTLARTSGWGTAAAVQLVALPLIGLALVSFVTDRRERLR